MTTPSEGEAMLLPCPFCGGKAALCILEEAPGETDSAWVNCSCGVETRERINEHEAITRWNTRAAAQSSSGVREKIGALAHLYDLRAVNSIFAERTLIYATVANDIRAALGDKSAGAEP